MDADTLKSLEFVLRPTAPSAFIMQMQTPPMPGVQAPTAVKPPIIAPQHACSASGMRCWQVPIKK